MELLALGLGQFASHFFMSINMIGALLGAPIAGLLSDRLGRRKVLVVVALSVNGLTLLGIAYAYRHLDSYAILLALRLIEGAELQFKGAEILSRLRRDWETHAAQAT